VHRRCMWAWCELEHKFHITSDSPNYKNLYNSHSCVIFSVFYPAASVTTYFLCERRLRKWLVFGEFSIVSTQGCRGQMSSSIIDQSPMNLGHTTAAYGRREEKTRKALNSSFPFLTEFPNPPRSSACSYKRHTSVSGYTKYFFVQMGRHIT